MPRSEFSKTVRWAAWQRCDGRCEKCGAKLWPGKYQFDHIQPDGLGGEATLENCMVLCSACHSEKTHKHDTPRMTKADNQAKAHFIEQSKHQWPKRKMNPPRFDNTKRINEDI